MDEYTPEDYLEDWKDKYNLEDDYLEYLLPEVEDAVNEEEKETRDKILASIEREVSQSEFVIVKKVGHGAFGNVYRGKRKKDNLTVAIKIIDLEESKDDIQTICREIKTLVDGKSCPQLTTYYGSHVFGTKLWIIMEYVDGGSVADRLKEKPLDEKEISIVVREVLIGLHYLASEGKIHRDIKAANILLSKTGEVKLGDFGASGQLTETATKCNTFVGSPHWMAPEIFASNKYDGKADIWSLGITCIEMANGVVPHYKVPPLKLITIIPKNPPPTLDKEKFSLDFQDFVSKCLIKNPNERPSVKDLLNHPFVKSAGKTETLKRQ